MRYDTLVPLIPRDITSNSLHPWHSHLGSLVVHRVCPPSATDPWHRTIRKIASLSGRKAQRRVSKLDSSRPHPKKFTALNETLADWRDGGRRQAG